MQKITRHQILGYVLIISGIISNVVNYFVNYNTDTQFGNFFFYIFSGLIAAFGLTLVFKKEEKKEDEERI